jgi:predicted ATPase
MLAYHRDSVLHPFVVALGRAARLGPEDPAETQLDKLETILAPARIAETAPRFASLLSIPTGGRYTPLALSATQLRCLTLAALLDQLEALARQKPVLMLLADAHWADATSLEVLDLTVERVRALPVLVLITFRPEYESPWTGLSRVTSIALDRLAPAEVATLAEHVAGRPLPPEVTAQIVAKTDGVPLFVEELTKTVLEGGLLVAGPQGWRLDGPLPPFAIPSTLQDSLAARLDRLAPVKEIAQIGAVIGREFSPAVARDRRPRRAGVGHGTGAARSGGAAVPLGRSARRALHLQACAGPGHGLRDPRPCSRAGGRSCTGRSPMPCAESSRRSRRPSRNSSPTT